MPNSSNVHYIGSKCVSPVLVLEQEKTHISVRLWTAKTCAILKFINGVTQWFIQSPTECTTCPVGSGLGRGPELRAFLQVSGGFVLQLDL